MARPMIHDLTGLTYGDLYVEIKLSGAQKKQLLQYATMHDTIWLCKCKCGRVIYATGGNLRAGNTRNCGNCTTYQIGDEYVRCYMMHGGSFIVDLDDFERVKLYKWFIGLNGYIHSSRQGKVELLHRFILRPPPNLYVDHINGDRTDCRKCNLRVVTPVHNCWNRHMSKSNSTGYKGVYYDRQKRMYASEIYYDRCRRHLGRFPSPEEAAIAYNKAAIRYFGEYARVNVIGQPFRTVSVATSEEQFIHEEDHF